MIEDPDNTLNADNIDNMDNTCNSHWNEINQENHNILANTQDTRLLVILKTHHNNNANYTHIYYL